MKNIKIQFGALAEPLSKQLEGVGIDEVLLQHLQNDSDAISSLFIRGLLTDAESDKAYKRLINKVLKAIKDVLPTAKQVGKPQVIYGQ